MPNTNLVPLSLSRSRALGGTVLDHGPATEWSSPADSLRTLYRRKGTLLLITLSGILITALVSLVQPRLYRSVASLEVQGVNENFLNLREVDPAATLGNALSEPYVKTQAEILQQDVLIEQVIAQLKLEDRADFRPHPGFWGKLLRTAASNPSPGTLHQYAKDVVRSHLKIEPARDSQIVRITFDARDPQLAATFANTLAQVFIDQSVDKRRSAAEDIRRWLAPRIDELKSRLQNSESAVDAYTRESGLILTPGQDSLATQKLQTLQDELSKAQADLIAKQAQFDLIAKNPADITTENPVIRDYDVKLTDLRRQLADLESILQPGNYKVVRLQAQIAELESAVRAETVRANRSVRGDFLAAQRRELTLDRVYESQSTLVSNLAAKITHYNTLKREVDTNRQFYEAMLQKVNEAGVASAVRQSNVRLAAPAEPELHPYKPNLPLNLAIGLVAGLVLAVGFVMLSEQSNPSLRAPGEAGIYLNLPELGTIPSSDRIESSLHKMLGSTSGDRPVERVTWEQRFSELSEAFRGTVASIVSMENGGRRSVLVATSPLAGEGKTTVVSNLGISLAEISGRVLLIDGDMRRPRLHKVFGVANSWGLSDLLGEQNATEELPLEALVKKTRIPRLYLLPSGPCTDSIFSLLYSPRMERLVQRFRQEFDYVILDTPPCLEFADARILARYAEGVLLVLRANYADKKTALAAAQRFFLDGIPILGTILNQWDPITWGDTYRYGYYRKVYDRTAS
jgi:polysaccharide biosynthesis transport protein